ncbi:ester cyclase [Microbispora sp. ATCC PTA-5024]|uniref:ester cyclase n=1 Tax=Microbispora sp. ATCC PTA-5024 TaxID=316330 RepID=UPI0003DC98C7|nr:nuclear transport factor 2 family protein [Microbispora sp. ATCC PTA-5024]ETK30484.1 hypothetical protein MPTA5024_39900 [Microbispora sp. ATCC PTA-5024]
MPDVVNAVSVVDRFFSAYNAHDPEAVLSCFAPQAASVGPPGQSENRDQILSYYELIWTGFPDVTFTVWQTITEGDEVAATSMAAGTHTGPFTLPDGEVIQGTGRRVAARVCWVFGVENGLIVSQQVFYDQLEVYAQLGLSCPAPVHRP